MRFGVKKAGTPITAAVSPGLTLRRRCACGTHTPGGGACKACAAKEAGHVGGLFRKATVAALVSPKLKVNQPGDRFEQEADLIADAVMRTALPQIAPVAGTQKVPARPHAAGPNPDRASVVQRSAVSDELEKLEPLTNWSTPAGPRVVTIVFGGFLDHSRLFGWSDGPVELGLLPQLEMEAREYQYFEWTDGREAEAYATLRLQDDPSVVFELVGHSLGGDTAIEVANRLKARSIPVTTLLTLDPVSWLNDEPADGIRWINAPVDGYGNASDLVAMAGGRYGPQAKAKNIELDNAVRHGDARDMYEAIQAYRRDWRDESKGPNQSEERKKKLRRSASAVGPEMAPPSVDAVLGTPGQPLDAATRDFFEPRFGLDLSHVRVHTDDSAAASAADVSASAYAVGNHIVFGAGASPTQDGHLLAHELAHTIQHAAPGELRRTRLGPNHIDLGLDPKDPADFLRRLKDFMQQTVQENAKRGGATHAGHVEKVEAALRQVKNAEKEGTISKSIARAARNIVAKHGGPKMAEVLGRARFQKLIARRLARLAESRTAKRAASAAPLLGWAFSANDAWSGVKDVAGGHVGRGLSGISCAGVDVAADLLHLGDAVSGVGGTALSLGVQAGTIGCQIALDVQRAKEKLEALHERLRQGQPLPPDNILRDEYGLDDEAIQELKDHLGDELDKGDPDGPTEVDDPTTAIPMV